MALEGASLDAGQGGVWLALGGCARRGSGGPPGVPPAGSSWRSSGSDRVPPRRPAARPHQACPAAPTCTGSRGDLLVREGRADPLAVVVSAAFSRMPAPVFSSPEKQACPCELRWSRLSVSAVSSTGTPLSGPHSVLTRSCFSSLTLAPLPRHTVTQLAGLEPKSRTTCDCKYFYFFDLLVSVLPKSPFTCCEVK